MRDERYVFIVAKALGKALQTEICVVQTPKSTEWRVGDKGFAVGPHPTSYPPKQLVQTIIKYLTPPIPKKVKHEED